MILWMCAHGNSGLYLRDWFVFKLYRRSRFPDCTFASATLTFCLVVVVARFRYRISRASHFSNQRFMFVYILWKPNRFMCVSLEVDRCRWFLFPSSLLPFDTLPLSLLPVCPLSSILRFGGNVIVQWLRGRGRIAVRVPTHDAVLYFYFAAFRVLIVPNFSFVCYDLPFSCFA